MNNYFELNKRLSKLESILDSKSKSKSIVNEIISPRVIKPDLVKNLAIRLDKKLTEVLEGRFVQLLEYSTRDIDLRIVDKNNKGNIVKNKSNDKYKLIGRIVFNFDIDKNGKDDTYLLLTGKNVNTREIVKESNLTAKVIALYKEEIDKLQNNLQDSEDQK